MPGQIGLEGGRENFAPACGSGPARNPIVVEPLTIIIRELALSRAHFERLIDARKTDLDDDPPASLAALEDYAEASSARLVYLALQILGVRAPAAGAGGLPGRLAYSLPCLV